MIHVLTLTGILPENNRCALVIYTKDGHHNVHVYVIVNDRVFQH